MLDHRSCTHITVQLIQYSLLITTACLALSACGGGDRSVSDVTERRSNDPQASVLQPRQVEVPTQSTLGQTRADPMTISLASSVESGGVRPDVAAVIASFEGSDTQRLTLSRAALAMQAVLSVNLARSSELQAVVNELAQARACVRSHLVGNSESAWGGLSARTYDTLLRRLRQALFLVASRLLTQAPSGVLCTAASPGSGGESGGGISLPPSPSQAPSVTQQLRSEIDRLEQQGVLPALDRNADVRGPDANSNGVRDDIDAYIGTLSLIDVQRSALLQTARVQQLALLVDVGDKAAVTELGRRSMAATACLADSFEPERRLSYSVALRIEAITANTPERAARYLKYLGALSGTSTAYPDEGYCED